MGSCQQLAKPGDVIVVDAGGGDLTNALVGEIMSDDAIKRKRTGMILNGAIRDSAWVRAGNLPVFTAGVTHRGPYKDEPGEINVSVSIEGMVMPAGRSVVGDDDGCFCLPFD